PRREGEAHPRGVPLAISLDHLAGRPPAEESALEEVFLPAEPGPGPRGTARAGLFVLDQGLEHADRGVERRPRRAVGGLAVPAAVGQLLAEQPVDDAPDVLAEVGAARRHLAVDARLDLAREEGIAVAFLRAASLPRHAVADEARRAPCLGARGIETHFAQQRQDVHRGVPPAVPGRATPPAVGRLQGEQPRASALGGDPRALGRDLLRGRIGQVPHHLPADRRVLVEQPGDDRHGSASDGAAHPPAGIMPALFPQRRTASIWQQYRTGLQGVTRATLWDNLGPTISKNGLSRSSATRFALWRGEDR